MHSQQVHFVFFKDRLPVGLPGNPGIHPQAMGANLQSSQNLGHLFHQHGRRMAMQRVRRLSFGFRIHFQPDEMDGVFIHSSGGHHRGSASNKTKGQEYGVRREAFQV